MFRFFSRSVAVTRSFVLILIVYWFAPIQLRPPSLPLEGGGSSKFIAHVHDYSFVVSLMNEYHSHLALCDANTAAAAAAHCAHYLYAAFRRKR